MASSWQIFNPMKPSNIPECPGVYVVLIDGLAVYVGQSMRLRSRIYAHKFRYGYGKDVITPWGDFDMPVRVEVKIKKTKRMGDWAMWEIRLIHKLKPKYNVTHMKLHGGK